MNLEQARRIARVIHMAGGQLFVVGGWVRDTLLGTDTKDMDFEVFGLTPERLRTVLGQFGSVNTVGASFGVYKLDGADFSIPRRDSKMDRGHKGFVIQGDPSMSLHEAARRRDFTINAVSFDPLTEQYHDPFDGIKDMRERRLRAVDPELFGDDSLRVLRGVQFAARFEMDMDGDTKNLCRRIDLSDLPAERVWGEFEKLLRLAPLPSVGFELALELGVVRRLWPELYALGGIPQDAEWHPEGDVWTHTMHVVDYARGLLDDEAPVDSVARDITVMLAALFHDLGKATTTAFIDGRFRALGHEEAGVAPTTRMLDRLNVHSIDGYDVRSQVLALVEHHLAPFALYAAPKVRNSAFRRLSHKCDLMLLARVAEADSGGRPPLPVNDEVIAWFVDRVNMLDLREGPPPAILMGRHLLALGMQPGPEMGRILKAVYEKQMDGTVATLDDAIAVAKEMM